MRKRSADQEAATLADIARMSAKGKGVSVVEMFVRIASDATAAEARPTHLPPGGALRPVGTNLSKEEERKVRLRKLRLDLEAALLRMDAWCLPGDSRVAGWPTENDLDKLDELIDEAAAAIGKRIDRGRWRRCTRLNRHFPKMRLCRRISAFLARFTSKMPPRPYALLVRCAGVPCKGQVEAFFSKMRDARNGIRDPMGWLQFESLLVRYQDAELQRAGKRPRKVLMQSGATKEIQAYVAFLEIEHCDLIWIHRYTEHLVPTESWIVGLGNPELLLLLEPFSSELMVGASIAGLNEAEAEGKRRKAAERKAKSRKKMGKKV